MRDRAARSLVSLVLALASVLWVAPGWAGGVTGNRLEIVSPVKGYVTGAPSLDVTVRFTAGPGRPHRPERLLHAIVLTANGRPVARFDLPAAVPEVVHTFVLDLDAHREGTLVLHALALGRRGPLAGSGVVPVRIDRDASNGVLVGPGGGALSTADGRLTLTVPEGALSGWQRIEVRPASPGTLPPLPPGVSLAFAYELLPHGLQFARPVEVAVTVADPTQGDTATAGHAPVVLLNQSGGVETLSDQRLLLDFTGAAVARGSLLHFSTLFGGRFDEVFVRVDGVPDVVEIDEAFFPTVTVTDVEASILTSAVVYTDPDLVRLRRVEPSQSAEPAVSLGTLRAQMPDRLTRELVYRCTGFGMGTYRARVDLAGGLQVFGQILRASVALEKPVFCHAASGTATSPAGFPASIATSVAPLDAVRRVGESVDFELREDAGGFPPSVGAAVDVRVVDLSPGVLSEVPALSPAELSLQSGTDRQTGLPEHRYSVGLEPGVERRQTLRYTCQAGGTTTLRFTFVYGRGIGYVETLLATVTCGDAGQPPVVTSSPVTAAVVGVGYAYDVEATDPEGREVTYSLADAPLGMRIDFQTGLITWTPGATQAGAHEVVVLAVDATHVVEHRFTVTVDGDADGDGFGDAVDRCATAGQDGGCARVVPLGDGDTGYCETVAGCADLGPDGGQCTTCSIVAAGGAEVDCQSRPGALCGRLGDGTLETTGGLARGADGGVVDCDRSSCRIAPDDYRECVGPAGQCVVTFPDGSTVAGCLADTPCTSIVAPGVTANRECSITLAKRTVGGDDAFTLVGSPPGSPHSRFDFSRTVRTVDGVGDGVLRITGQADSSIPSPPSVPTPYTVNLSEEGPAGWIGQLDCSSSVALFAGDHRTCTFTNTRSGLVPSVVGRPLEDGRQTIILQGFSVGAITINTASAFPPGIIELQDPPAFSEVPLGTPVDLVVAGEPLDTDGDGVADSRDSCGDTDPGSIVDDAGCAAYQRDSDGDGLNDAVDVCPLQAGPVGGNGCPLPPGDDDFDGVPDLVDECPDTPLGEPVDFLGCSQEQNEDDGTVVDIGRRERSSRAGHGILAQGNVSDASTVVIAGETGYVIETIGQTRELISASANDTPFGRNTGAFLLGDPGPGGEHTLVIYGLGLSMRQWIPDEGRFGIVQIGSRFSNFTDGVHLDGDPGARGAILVDFQASQVFGLVPVEFTPGQPFYGFAGPLANFAFPSTLGRIVSAFAANLVFTPAGAISPASTGRLLVVTDGDPGLVYLVDPANPTAGTLVGSAGRGPRTIRCLLARGVCVVANFLSNTLTIVRWDGGEAASIVDEVPVGATIGIDLREATDTTTEVVSTGFDDDTVTFTTLDSALAVVSSETVSITGCNGAGHALYIGPSRDVLVSCESDSVVVSR
jgi:hypothetical protein